MTLQGLSDETYLMILNETCAIQYLIIKSGGMATKSLVENILMERYGFERGDAHTLTNAAESRSDFKIGYNGVQWTAKRPEPTLDDYIEVKNSLDKGVIRCKK